MRRIVPAVAATLVLTAACSAGQHQGAGHAAASPVSPGATAAALTESATCTDYLNASKKARYAFIAQEVRIHVPQTAPPETLPASFAPGGKPKVIDGNEMTDNLSANFLQGILDNKCPEKPSTRIMTLLTPAWTSSPTP